MDDKVELIRAKIGTLLTLPLSPGTHLDLKIGENIGGFTREIIGIAHVSSLSELRGILKIAQENSFSVSPYSTGNNWGYGSHLPVRNHCLLLDFSPMNQILEIDEQQGTAIIQPGVTQGNLAIELKRRNSQFYVDVTGSGMDTSLIGNCLERGIAYQEQRVTQVLGLDIVLSDGTLLKSGFGDYPNSKLNNCYPYGLGPSVDGLFFQSNLGIIIQARIALQRRPEKAMVVSLPLESKKLGQLIDRLKELKRIGCIQGIPHIGNRERTISTLEAIIKNESPNLSNIEILHVINKTLKSDWIATFFIAGPLKVAESQLQETRVQLRDLGSLFVHQLEVKTWRDKTYQLFLNLIMSREQKIIFKAAASLRGLNLGESSNAGIEFLRKNQKVDQSPVGFLLCTPLAPLRGENGDYFNEMFIRFRNKYNLFMAMTLNIISNRVLEAVISIHFNKNDSVESDRALIAVRQMSQQFSADGFYPYRINIDQMDDFLELNLPIHDFQRNLKKLLDPNSIISPGRYT